MENICNCENFKEKCINVCQNNSSMKCNYLYDGVAQCSFSYTNCGFSELIHKEPPKDKASEAIKSIKNYICPAYLKEVDIIEQELKAKDKEIELITSDSKGILAIMESQRESMRDKDALIETKNKKIWDLGCDVVALKEKLSKIREVL